MATTRAAAIQRKRLRGEHGLDVATMPGQCMNKLAGHRSGYHENICTFPVFPGEPC